MSRMALSALERYRNKTHDCSWWLLGAEQTMTSPRLCHGKSRRPLQPFKYYFGTWARSHSCIPVGCSPGWGQRGSAGACRVRAFPGSSAMGRGKGCCRRGNRKDRVLKILWPWAVGCEITLSGLGAQTAPSGKQAEQRRRAQGSDFSLQPFLRF